MCVYVCVFTTTEPNKDIQKLLKPSCSGDLSKELYHHPVGEEEGGLPGHTAGLLHVTERRREYRGKGSDGGVVDGWMEGGWIGWIDRKKEWGRMGRIVIKGW